jgi:hypothetical protein
LGGEIQDVRRLQKPYPPGFEAGIVVLTSIFGLKCGYRKPKELGVLGDADLAREMVHFDKYAPMVRINLFSISAVISVAWPADSERIGLHSRRRADEFQHPKKNTCTNYSRRTSHNSSFKVEIGDCLLGPNQSIGNRLMFLRSIFLGIFGSNVGPWGHQLMEY